MYAIDFRQERDQVCMDCVFYILQEAGSKLKMLVQGLLTLPRLVAHPHSFGSLINILTSLSYQ